MKDPRFYDDCCGACKYSEWKEQDVFVCNNPESEGYGLETMFTDYCPEFESDEYDDFE